MMMEDGEDANSLTNVSILAGRLQSAIVNGSVHHLRHYLFNEIDRNDPFWKNPDEMNVSYPTLPTYSFPPSSPPHHTDLT